PPPPPQFIKNKIPYINIHYLHLFFLLPLTPIFSTQKHKTQPKAQRIIALAGDAAQKAEDNLNK
ncbi:hypothetical protein, partial [Acinetobacter baumannii]